MLGIQLDRKSHAEFVSFTVRFGDAEGAAQTMVVLCLEDDDPHYPPTHDRSVCIEMINPFQTETLNGRPIQLVVWLLLCWLLDGRHSCDETRK